MLRTYIIGNEATGERGPCEAEPLTDRFLSDTRTRIVVVETVEQIGRDGTWRPTSLWLVAADGREWLVTSDKSYRTLWLEGDSDLQSEADRFMLAMMQSRAAAPYAPRECIQTIGGARPFRCRLSTVPGANRCRHHLPRYTVPERDARALAKGGSYGSQG